MYFMREKQLRNMAVSMNIVKTLSQINEYKGKQVIYKKQPKDVLERLSKDTILNFSTIRSNNVSLDTDKENLDKIVNNETTPKTREEIDIVECRDLVNTVNSAYEDISINSQTILELHGYLYKYSLIRGGRYRLKNAITEQGINNLEYKNFIELDSNEISKSVETLCLEYNNIIEKNEIDILITVATFILDFILIQPFKEGNIKMAKILLLLLLNKNGYEVGKYIGLSTLLDESYCDYINVDNNLEEYNGCSITKWLEYFLDTILIAYIDLDNKLFIVDNKKKTKRDRIEKIINSTLGYFTKDDIKELCPDIPEATINRVFNNLRKEEKIEVIAKGRSAKWKKKY